MSCKLYLAGLQGPVCVLQALWLLIILLHPLHMWPLLA